MKNPTQSLKRTLQRVRNGAAVVARRLRSVFAVVREVLNSIRERHPTPHGDRRARASAADSGGHRTHYRLARAEGRRAPHASQSGSIPDTPSRHLIIRPSTLTK